MNALRLLDKEIFLEIFYGKRKKINFFDGLLYFLRKWCKKFPKMVY